MFINWNILDKDKSNLSICVQIPQNIFIGLSELFAVVASYEFAYFAAPRSAQSLFMSFRFTAAGIASFIGIGLSNSFLTPADNDVNSNVSIKTEVLLFFSLIFLIFWTERMVEILYLLLYSCRCPTDFHCYFYHMS